MKKNLLALSLLIVSSMSSFANPTNNEEPKAALAFSKMFAGAQNVKWTQEQGGYLQVAFTWGDHRAIAFFDADAKFAGSIRGLFFKELPLSVIRSVNRTFDNPVVLEVSEIYNEEGVYYSMELEYNNKPFKVKLDGHGNLVEKTRIKK